MKKFFTFFAAVLVALSVTAAPATSQLAVKKLEAKLHSALLTKKATVTEALEKNAEKNVARKSAHVEATASDNVISLGYDASQSVINVTTTNSDTYFYLLISTTLYTGFGGQDYSAESLLGVTESVLATFDRQGYTQYFIAAGDKVIFPEEDYVWNDDMVDGYNYLAIAVPYAEGAINGTPVYTTFTYVAPVPTSYTDITIDGAQIYKGYLGRYGILDVYGWDNDSTSYVEFLYNVNNSITGDLTATDPDAVYDAYLAFVNGTDTTKVDARIYIDFAVTVNNEDYTLTTHMLGKDGNGYSITINFSTAVVVTDTIILAMNGTVDAASYASYGYTEYDGYTSDEGYELYLLMPQAAGTYNLDDIYNMNDYQYGSALVDWNNRALIEIVSANIVIAADGSFTADLISVEGVLYKISFNQPTATALENVEAAKAQKVIENGQVIIIRDGKKFNLMGAEL